MLVGGTLPATAIYALTCNVALSGVTGLRLEPMTDPSLPAYGPGAGNPGGNFVLTEILVSAVPAALPLLAGWACWA